MNEEPVQVLKQKHPGRVAEGKKLAEFNRKRKEEMLKLVQTNQEPSQVITQEPSQLLEKEPVQVPASSFNNLYSAGGGVIILLIGGAYAGYMFYVSKNSKPELKIENPLIRCRKKLL